MPFLEFSQNFGQSPTGSSRVFAHTGEHSYQLLPAKAGSLDYAYKADRNVNVRTRIYESHLVCDELLGFQYIFEHLPYLHFLPLRQNILSPTNVAPNIASANARTPATAFGYFFL